jgi:predicted PurR-regulated permease PerM
MILGFDRTAARVTWTAWAVTMLLYGFYLAGEAAFILVLAVFVAYALWPMTAFLQRHTAGRFSRRSAAAIVFIAVIGAGALAFALLGSRVVQEGVHLAQQIPRLKEDPSWMNAIPLPSWLEVYRARMQAFVYDQIAGGLSQAVPFLRQVARRTVAIAGNVVYVVLVPIMAFLLVKDAPLLRSAFLGFVKPRHEPVWRKLLDDVHDVLAHYVKALALLSIATFTTYSIAFALMGLSYALFLAAMAAVLELVPLAGPLLALVAALIVAMVTGYEHFWWILAFGAAYRVFQDYVLSPALMSGRVDVHPLLVLVGIVAGEQIGGVIGMFLAVPAIAIAGVILRVLRASRAEPGAPASI